MRIIVITGFIGSSSPPPPPPPPLTHTISKPTSVYPAAFSKGNRLTTFIHSEIQSERCLCMKKENQPAAQTENIERVVTCKIFKENYF